MATVVGKHITNRFVSFCNGLRLMTPLVSRKFQRDNKFLKKIFRCALRLLVVFIVVVYVLEFILIYPSRCTFNDDTIEFSACDFQTKIWTRVFIDKDDVVLQDIEKWISKKIWTATPICLIKFFPQGNLSDRGLRLVLSGKRVELYRQGTIHRFRILYACQADEEIISLVKLLRECACPEVLDGLENPGIEALNGKN